MQDGPMSAPTQLVDDPGRRSDVCIAVLDGPVDVDHGCFVGASLELGVTLAPATVRVDGMMSQHGTHVASVLFGQANSEVPGLVPECRGLILPVFTDDGRRLTQLDLARAIEQAVEAGADLINISGGQIVDDGAAEPWLVEAARRCEANDVVIVAAAGNEGCRCLHVPASLPAVLAVGACDAEGQPLESSNWGDAYQDNGVLAPGHDVLGARPGGGTTRASGTSFATPFVTGLIAQLLAERRRRGLPASPQAMRDVLLSTAGACNIHPTSDPRRCLAGRINIEEAQKVAMSDDTNQVIPAACNCTKIPPKVEESAQSTSEIRPSAPEHARNPWVYTIGTLGYDFGTEARRDSFKQLMPPFEMDNTQLPANPYDARQMVDYLGHNLAEASSLIWTLNIELTPLYAIEPVGPFSRDVFAVLQDLLAGQVSAESDASYIERVSIPGRLTGRSVRLFSGQVVPVVEPHSPRGMYGWKINSLVEAAIKAVRGDAPDDAHMRRSLTSFLNRVYYDLRNFGQTSKDRALNFAATNAFQAAQTFAEAVGAGMELDGISVDKSPFCRMDSDCWDVMLKFFDPENIHRARKIFRFTIDVSDLIPVTLGEVRSWSSAQ
jgi:hypothetical protein